MKPPDWLDLCWAEPKHIRTLKQNGGSHSDTVARRVAFFIYVSSGFSFSSIYSDFYRFEIFFGFVIDDPLVIPAQAGISPFTLKVHEIPALRPE